MSKIEVHLKDWEIIICSIMNLNLLIARGWSNKSGKDEFLVSDIIIDYFPLENKATTDKECINLIGGGKFYNSQPLEFSFLERGLSITKAQYLNNWISYHSVHISSNLIENCYKLNSVDSLTNLLPLDSGLDKCNATLNLNRLLK